MLTATQPALNLERVDGGDVFAQLEEDWLRLQSRSGATSFFQSWEWNRCWWKHFGRGRTPHVIRFRRGGDTVGIAPCFLDGRIAPTLRWIGTGNADYLGLIVRSQDISTVSLAFADHLVSDEPAALADLHQLRQDTPLARHFPDCALEQAGTNHLNLPFTWEEYVGSLTAKMRSNIKRARRDLEAAGATMRVASADEVPEAMETLFRLHGDRWRSRGLPGSFVGPKVRTFHMDWAETAAKLGWMRLILLEIGGEVRAAMYGVEFDRVFYYFQAGFDPKISTLSPGTALVAHAIELAISERCAGFDFLRGQERYKSRWKPQDVSVNVRLVVPLGGWLARAGCKWRRNVHAVETRIRQRFEGGSLLKAPE